MTSHTARELNALPLFDVLALYEGLQPLTTTDVAGVFEAELVGPSWLRMVGRFGLSMAGAADFWGKWFDGTGHGTNLFDAPGGLTDRVDFVADTGVSGVARGQALVLSYRGAPAPWWLLRGEVRRYTDDVLLGVVVLRALPQATFALPYLLHARPDVPFERSPRLV